MYHACKFHLQGAKITYEREANLVIDYSSLSRNLKQVRLIHCLFALFVCHILNIVIMNCVYFD